jgi:hypothetical protein
MFGEKKRLTFFQTFYLSHFLFALSDLKSYECVNWSFTKVPLNSKANKTNRLICKVTLSSHPVFGPPFTPIPFFRVNPLGGGGGGNSPNNH